MTYYLKPLGICAACWFTAYFAALAATSIFALPPKWNPLPLFMFWAEMAYMRILLMGLSK